MDNEIDSSTPVQTLTKTTKNPYVLVTIIYDYSQLILVLGADFLLFLKRGLWQLNSENSSKFLDKLSI